MRKRPQRSHESLDDESMYMSKEEIAREFSLRYLKCLDIWSQIGNSQRRLEHTSDRRWSAEGILDSPQIRRAYEAATNKEQECIAASVVAHEQEGPLRRMQGLFAGESRLARAREQAEKLRREHERLLDDLADAVDREIAACEQLKERRKAEWRKRLSDLDALTRLSPRVFEMRVADMFRAVGSVEVTPASGDQGVDVIVVRGRRRFAIQCKRFLSSQVRKLPRPVDR